VATSADVARLAGVSLSTVSHVLNGTRPVREATRQRVLAAIEATSYEPDGVARSLRRAKTDSVGVVVDDTSQPAFAAMIRGIEMEASTAALTLLLAHSRGDPERELQSVRVLRERRVDGLLIAEGSAASGQLLELLRSRSSPVVLIDRLDAVDLDQVGVDNAPAMRALIGHIVGLGHTRVGLVAGDLTVATLREREHGYRLALADGGVPVDETLILAHREGPELSHAIRALLAGPDRPSAVASSSVTLTVELLKAIKELRLGVPEDIVVVAFDTFAHSEFFSPHLTSVDQPAVEIGRQAMRLLLRRMLDPDMPPRALKLPATIVHGDSCGCAEPRSPLPIA
jgi:LacI family transcriptional regulator